MSTDGTPVWIGSLEVPATAPVEQRPLPPLLIGLGVLVFGLVTVLSAIIEVLLIPLYIGSTIFPLTILLAVAGNLVLPQLMRGVVETGLRIWLPAILWALTVMVLGFVNTSGGDVLVPGYGDGQYVSLVLLFGGVLASIIGTLRATNPRRRPVRPPAPSVTAGSARR